MPHCKQCDVELTDFEATRRQYGTFIYLDLCTLCFLPISNEVKVSERYDLFGDSDTEEAEGTCDEDPGELGWRYVEEDTNSYD